MTSEMDYLYRVAVTKQSMLHLCTVYTPIRKSGCFCIFRKYCLILPVRLIFSFLHFCIFTFAFLQFCIFAFSVLHIWIQVKIDLQIGLRLLKGHNVGWF